MLNDRETAARTLHAENSQPWRRAAAGGVPSLLACGCMILALRVALRVWGFRRVLAWIGRRVGSTPATASLDLDTVRNAERVVATAGALYPGRALCLEQSLVLYYLLRRQGVRVTYCQGVRPQPFEAHAWIEYRGEVINDVPEHTRQFARLQDLLP
jgi:hypothetical protein